MQLYQQLVKLVIYKYFSFSIYKNHKPWVVDTHILKSISVADELTASI